MPAKMARSIPRPPFGPPEVPAAVRISRLSCGEVGKSLLSTLVSESSGECRIRLFLIRVGGANEYRLGISR